MMTDNIDLAYGGPVHRPHWYSLIRPSHKTMVAAISTRGREVYDIVHFRFPTSTDPVHVAAVVLSEPVDGMVAPQFMVWVGVAKRWHREAVPYSRKVGCEESVRKALSAAHRNWTEPDMWLPSVLHGKELYQVIRQKLVGP